MLGEKASREKYGLAHFFFLKAPVRTQTILSTQLGYNIGTSARAIS